ncbi:MAG: glycoside hydrolase family 25 protein [Lachnospiraceae bacterium]|nr:glycoside hydrolase family 25 protein [Lachnospiraceae bacterium]
MKRLLAGLLTICMIVATLTPVRADEIDQLVDEVDQTLESVQKDIKSVEKEVEELDKPMGSNYISDGSSIGRMSVPKAPSNSIGKGVDISKWNWPPNKSENIDFSKLSKSVDFVIIRCGYGGDSTDQDDAYFKKSVQGCEKYDIPYGVYLYSYATSTSKAKSEAKHTLRMLEEAGADPDLPVFLDMEDDSQAGVSASTKADIAKTYCNMIEEEGYATGIYANKNWWENYLTNSYFNSVTKWVAQYNTSCTYKKDYAIWQCSESATVSGISGVVDLNYMVDDIYVKKLKAEGYSGTYDGKSHTVKVANYKEGTEVQYSKDNENWSTTKPTRKKVGTTTVYYKATDKDGQEVTGTLKIKISARKVSTCTISSISNKTYTGSQIKPGVTIKYGTTTLQEGTDYEVSYGANKSTGKATVTITGKGNFTGTKTITFYIVPKKVSSVKASKGSKKKSAVVKWAKTTGSTGYRIAYSRKGQNKWSYVNVSSTSKTFSGLSAKTYDVKVRAYKTVSGEKKYGSYSAVKTMTAK